MKQGSANPPDVSSVFDASPNLHKSPFEMVSWKESEKQTGQVQVQDQGLRKQSSEESCDE